MLKTEAISYSIGKKHILNNVSTELKGYQGNVFYNEKKIETIKKEELAKKDLF